MEPCCFINNEKSIIHNNNNNSDNNNNKKKYSMLLMTVDLMFGWPKVKINSESGASTWNHLFFGPLSTFPPKVIIIIIAQPIIDIKGIKLEFICYSELQFLKVILMTFQNFENVHFYYVFFFLTVGIDLVSEEHWASKECLLKWSQLFKINWVFLHPPWFSFPSSLLSSLWYGLSFKRLGQVHASFKQTG